MIPTETVDRLPEYIYPTFVEVGESETGALDILNCGAGHLTVSFDKGDSADKRRAKSMIADMLNRGYSIFIEVEEDGKKVLKRVESFDPEHSVYTVKLPRGAPRGRRGPSKVSVPMHKTRATAVGATAGG